MKYRPWLSNIRNLLFIFIFFIFSIYLSLYLFSHDISFHFKDKIRINNIIYAFIAIFNIINIYFIKINIKQYKNRRYGIKVEGNSVSAALLLDWGSRGWKVWEDKNNYSGIGNLDLVAMDKNKTLFLIEIKSYHGIKTNKDGTVSKRNGTPFFKNPLKQVKSQVNFVLNTSSEVQLAVPVLWLPVSYGGTVLFDGVLIIQGDEKKLFKALINFKVGF